MELIKPGININFVGRRYWAMCLSALAILASVISIVVQGGLKLGVDFSGGIHMQVRFVKQVRLTYQVGPGAKVTAQGVKDRLTRAGVSTGPVNLTGGTLRITLNHAFNVNRAVIDLKNGFTWPQARQKADDVARARALLAKLGGLTYQRAEPVDITLRQIKRLMRDPSLKLLHATVQTVYLSTETDVARKTELINLEQIKIRQRGQVKNVPIMVPARYVACYDIRAQEQDPELGNMIEAFYRDQTADFPIRWTPEGEDEAPKPGDLLGVVQRHFRQNLPGVWFVIPESETVGPQVGEDLRKNALGAIFAALVLITAYISGRFQNQWPVGIGMAVFGVVYAWIAVNNFSEMTLLISIIVALGLTLGVSVLLGLRYALGATVALIHDVLITVGVFSVTGKAFTLSIVAALLTIIGYSLNDTIVVFDRIRENVNKAGRTRLDEIVNRSINETLARTILTSGTTLVVLLSLYFLGGASLQDFALAMIIGIAVGTYSSVYVASPIILLWPEMVTAKAGVEAAAKLTAKLPGRKPAAERPVKRAKPAVKKVKAAPKAEPEPAEAPAKAAVEAETAAKPTPQSAKPDQAITKGKTVSKGQQKKAAGGKKRKKKKKKR
ncbi:MAG: protein translocase subunit SecF [Proteobacteria bacterium]|nr:protein translocase subunit SecF [Pseudomonadota bacterium]